MTKRNKTVIIGPWLGELGWELLVWQAAVRFFINKHSYRHIYVITFKGRESLYKYKNVQIFEHDVKLKDASFGVQKVSKSEINKYIQSCVDNYKICESYDVFTPNKLFSFKYRVLRKVFSKYGLEYKNLGISNSQIKYNICFHFRNFTHSKDLKDKNLSLKKADILVDYFISLGCKVCCIGLPEYSYVPRKAVNCQSFSLQETINTISQSELVVGGSSAPMHLAQLCNKPIVTWINLPEGGVRYTKTWNPFKSKAVVVSGKSFNPDVRDIKKSVESALEI